MGILAAIKNLGWGPDDKKQDQLNWLANVRTSIEIHDPRQFYSSGDQIEGRVRLDLDEVVEIGAVDISYSVVASTQIYIDDSSSSSESSSSSSSSSSEDESDLSQRQLKKKYDERQKKLRKRRVKEQKRDETKSKKLVKRSKKHDKRMSSGRKSSTLTSKTVEFEQVIKLKVANSQEPMMKPGSYVFPFKIQLPGHAGDGYRQGLTSFEVAYGMGKVEHILKASCYRTTQFGQTQTSEKVVGFKTLGEPYASDLGAETLKERALFDVGGAFKRRKTVECAALTKLPRAVRDGQVFSIPIELECTPGCEFGLSKLTIEVRMETSLEAQSQKEKLVDRICVLEDKGREVLDAAALAGKLRDLCVPRTLVPSFRTMRLNLGYWLEINIEVYALRNRKNVKELHFGAPLQILPQIKENGRATSAFEYSQPRAYPPAAPQVGPGEVPGVPVVDSKYADNPPDYTS